MYKLCLTLTERDFTKILGDDFYRVLNVMNEAIGEENLSEDVLHLVLTGEGCRVPGLKRRIKETYFVAKFYCFIAPEQAVAQGAAIQACEIAEDPVRYLNLLDLDSKSAEERYEKEQTQ